MLQIRKEQVQTLSTITRKKLADSLCDHLNLHFSEQCLELGEKGVRSAVMFGIAAAEKYRFVRRVDIVKYVNLMFVFGRNFDTDPDYSWASVILNQSEETVPDLRMNRLYAKGLILEHTGSGLGKRPT